MLETAVLTVPGARIARPPAGTLQGRLTRLVQELQESDVDAVLLSPGNDLSYLLGRSHPSFERLSLLIVTAGGAATLVVPRLERRAWELGAADDLPVEVVTWQDGQDPYRLAAQHVGTAGTVEISDVTAARHVLSLAEALGEQTRLRPADTLRRVRSIKDEWETGELRKAGAAIDRVHGHLGCVLRPGRTEAEAGLDIEAMMLDEGFAQAAFISVGSGPNGAVPHHAVSGRELLPGDLVVVDLSGPLASGYQADSTRTYAMGEPAPEVIDRFAVLHSAFDQALATVRPGVTAERIDLVAREVLREADMAELFLHRTGHGIGLDVHEAPDIVAGNTQVLAANMTFSIEPGIYLDGRWGARIEDIVRVTDDGVESFNRRPHSLSIVD